MKNIEQKKGLKQSLCFLVVYAILAVITPIVLRYTVFENSAYSQLSNEGWAGFFGSYIGGVLGGVGTLLAMYITLKNTIEIQRRNKMDSDIQILQSNYEREREYNRDKNAREKERNDDFQAKEQEIRRAFMDEIARLLGVYLANISKCYYSSLYYSMYHKSKNDAYAEMKKAYDKLEKECTDVGIREAAAGRKIDALSVHVKRLELECEKKKDEYLERKTECEKNDERGNRIEANEAFFIIDCMLEGIQEADQFLKCLYEMDSKSNAFKDSINGGNVDDEWLKISIKDIKKSYGEFRDQYVYTTRMNTKQSH